MSESAKSQQPAARGRKPYSKPSVRRVPLRPEEAVLGFCKAAGKAGPNGGGTCTIPSACSSSGS